MHVLWLELDSSRTCQDGQLEDEIVGVWVRTLTTTLLRSGEARVRAIIVAECFISPLKSLV